MDALPSLIVVTGRPGSGKSTLVHPLARAIRCPVLSRDEIKEGLVNTLGPEGDLDRAAYEAFFDAIRLLLDSKVTLVAEAAFQHRLWFPRLEELRAVAKLRIVICSVEPGLAHSRHASRTAADPARIAFHDVGPLPEAYDPPRLPVPTLAVDTSDGYDPSFEAVVRFASPGGRT